MSNYDDVEGHMRAFLRAVFLILLIVLIGGGALYLRANPGVWQDTLVNAGLMAPASEALRASGFVEAREVSVAAEVSGRIVALAVDEGDRVTSGQALVTLDTTLLDRQITEARAAVDLAEAQLNLVQAGARREDIAIAQSAVAVAAAARDAAQQARQDAEARRDTPQDLDLQIAQAQTDLAVAEARIRQVTAAKDAAELLAGLRERQVALVDESPFAREDNKRQVWAGWNLASTDLWQAWTALNGAIAARDAARARLADLQAMRRNPQTLAIAAVQAEAALGQTTAAVPVAEAALAQVQSGASAEQVAVAEAAVAQARAAVAALQAQRSKYQVSAPISGVVLGRTAQPGETALPGDALLTLGNLETVDLTVTVPETEIGQVALDQHVAVIADAFPQMIFDGTVVWIADEAEFTPKTVQTRNERAGTVYAVKVRLPNDAGRLKPGMPAEAVFGGVGDVENQVTAAPQPAHIDRIAGSGTIEATAIDISTELGGRIATLLVGEGDTVPAGVPLVELDRTLLLAQREQAVAALTTAHADLARVEAPPRAEAVALAAAELARAKAARDGAFAVWQAAQAVITRPLELETQIDGLQSRVAILGRQIEGTQAAVHAAGIMRDEAARAQGSDEEKTIYQAALKQVEAAQAAQAVVEAELAGVRRQLQVLQGIRANPLALISQANAARSALAQAEAAVALAETRLIAAQSGARHQEVAVARAKVAQAAAALARIDAQMDRLVVTAPQAGVVLEQVANAGELAAPGATLLRLGELDRVTLTVYLPVADAGRVQVGQTATVRVDAYPEDVFRGTVAYLAPQAEFTPQNVQTRDDRADLVYAVEITLDNADHRLKPGMPAEAEIVE